MGKQAIIIGIALGLGSGVYLGVMICLLGPDFGGGTQCVSQQPKTGLLPGGDSSPGLFELAAARPAHSPVPPSPAGRVALPCDEWIRIVSDVAWVLQNPQNGVLVLRSNQVEHYNDVIQWIRSKPPADREISLIIRTAQAHCDNVTL